MTFTSLTVMVRLSEHDTTIALNSLTFTSEIANIILHSTDFHSIHNNAWYL